MISLIQMEYLVAVDTYRHFGMAAESCHVTQPTLSMQLRKLEDDLGVTVFDRTRKPVAPTDVGRELIAQARIILRESGRLQDIVDAHQGKIAGELKVGIIPSIAPYLVPRFMAGLARAHPQLKLVVEELMTHQILERLRDDRLDVGLLATPLHEADIREEALFWESIRIYAHPTHPVGQMEAAPAGQLGYEGLWMMGEGHCFRAQVISLCGKNATDTGLPFRYESGSLDTIRRLVEEEGGYSLLPELSLLGEEHDLKARVVPFQKFNPLREVGLAYVRRFSKKRLIEVMAEHIREAVPAEMRDSERGTIIEWN